MDKTRAEAFSDGVVAVAATVRVFNTATPDYLVLPILRERLVRSSN